MIGDMGKYVRALLDSTAPGASAMEQHLMGENGAEGYAGVILDQETGPTLTLHNGQTGGFASYLVLDREGKKGAIVLSNTAVQLPNLIINLVEKGITK